MQLKICKDVAINDIILVDSPGMIDSPEAAGAVDAQRYDRGYNFEKVCLFGSQIL
jgi:hypothetical protein